MPESKTRSLVQFAAEDAIVNELRQSNRRLVGELEKARVRNALLVDSVYKAAKDGILALELPEIPVPKKDERKRSAEIAVPVLSDLQLAKITPSYNSQVCEERIEKYADKVIELTRIQRADHPVRECRVYCVGDIVEGELIFPGQSHLIDASLYRQVTIDGPRIMGGFLQRMLAEFEKVHVVWVIGNHGALGGRSRKDYDPETNADRMLGRILQQIYAGEKRLTWNIPDGANSRSWYAVDTIGSKSYLLFHGDQCRGGGWGGLPFYGFHKAINGWASGGLNEHFDYAICGHWHQTAKLPFNTRFLYVNGSTESDNEYAQEELKSRMGPCQWLLFAHPEHGITAEYTVSLR